MHFFSLLLLLFQFLVGGMAADGDGGSLAAIRDDMTRQLLTILPLDPHNDTAIDILSRQVHSLFRDVEGVVHVVENRDDGQLKSWTVTVDDPVREDLLEPIRQLAGVRSLKLEPKSSPADEPSLESRQASVTTYIAEPKNGHDREETAKTLEFLKQTVVQDSWKIGEVHIDAELICWVRLYLDDAALEKVQKHPGIKVVGEHSHNGGPMRVVHEHRDADRRTGEAKPLSVGGNVRRFLEPVHAIPTIMKRAIRWTKQETPYAEDLRVVSQMPGVPIEHLPDFVYEETAGNDVYIYVLDYGVNGNVLNDDGVREFGNRVTEYLQTPLAASLHRSMYVDYENHGTPVASKAAGWKCGVAKRAKIVSVQMTYEDGDQSVALDIALWHIKGKHRMRNSIVLCSVSAGWDFSSIEATELRRVQQALMREGIPIVYSAGNDVGRSSNIDHINTITESPTHPLIVVGATDFHGVRWFDDDLEDGEQQGSQGGPHLTVYAVGKDSMIQERQDGSTTTETGTSFAAPVVAGVIANYMARYPQMPWDDSKNGIDRVHEIKRFIKSPASSYERWPRQYYEGQPDYVPVIWNGAKEEDHLSAQANYCKIDNGRPRCYGKPPTPRCYGASQTNRYLLRTTLSGEVINNWFCPKVELLKRQGGYSEKFLVGTPEEVELSITYPDNRVPDSDECSHFMHVIVNRCDSMNTGLDWKAGGEMPEINSNRWYKIVPQRLRLSPQDAPSGTCDLHYKFTHSENTISGRGWEGSNFGEELRDTLEGKSIGLSKWNFKYETKVDHPRPERSHEWKVDFNTIIGAEDKIEDAIRQVMAFRGKGIDCKKHGASASAEGWANATQSNASVKA